MILILFCKKLGNLSLKINAISNGLEKYMSFNIVNKLIFIDSFQFLSSSLDNLVKNLDKYNFKYFSQEFDNDFLDLDKQRGLYPYEYMSDFEKFKGKLSSTEKLYSSLTNKKISNKDYEHGVNVCDVFEMKAMKDYAFVFKMFYFIIS